MEISVVSVVGFVTLSVTLTRSQTMSGPVCVFCVLGHLRSAIRWQKGRQEVFKKTKPLLESAVFGLKAKGWRAGHFLFVCSPRVIDAEKAGC